MNAQDLRDMTNSYDSYEEPLLRHNKHVQSNVINNNESETNGYSVIHESRCHKVFVFLSKFTIELFMFLFMFSYNIRTNCITNLMLQKACLNQLNYSTDICRNLSYFKEQKDEVEKLANNYHLYSNIIQTGLGVIAMIFIGPWSDRYGRKLPLLITVLAFLLDNIGVILNTIYFTAPLGYLLIPNIFYGVTGGQLCISSTMFSMTSEVSTEKERTLKYTYVQFAGGLALSFGGLAEGMLYRYYSYLTVFTVATSVNIIALLWAIFIIKETREYEAPVEMKLTQKFKELFRFKNIIDGFRAYLKVRPNRGRIQLWLLLSSMCIMVLTSSPKFSVDYVYTVHMYNWGPAQFSIMESVVNYSSVIATIVLVPMFIKVLMVKDPILGIIGSIAIAVHHICTALATETWIYYIGQFFTLFRRFGHLAVRSRMSKIIEKDEQGKVFTFLVIAESLVPLVGSAAITKIFNSTLTFFAGLSFLICAGLELIPIISFLWMAQLKTAAVSVTEISSEVNGVHKIDD